MLTGVIHLFLCVVLAGPMSLPAWALVRPENRVGGSPGFSCISASESTSQSVEPHEDNLDLGYNFPSRLRKYLYAQGNPVNMVDPSGQYNTLRANCSHSGLGKNWNNRGGSYNSHHAHLQ